MTGKAAHSWHEANQAYLTKALATVRGILERRGQSFREGTEISKHEVSKRQALPKAPRAMAAPPALEVLSQLFRLSPFERTVLLLCAGMELQSGFPALCAAAQGDPRRTYPTFSLALAAFPGAHWSALSPEAPLRGWRLIEVGSGETLTLSQLRIDERILHYLTGVTHLDSRLVGLVDFVSPADDLVPSHRRMGERVAAVWSRMGGTSSPFIVQLCGEERSTLRFIAAAACAVFGLNLYAISAQAVPLEPRELEALIRLWRREAALTSSVLLLECGEWDQGDRAREHAISRLADGLKGLVILAGRERRLVGQKTMVTFDVEGPTPGEQRALWQGALGAAAEGLDGAAQRLVAQFNLTGPVIRAVCAEALASRLPEETPSPGDLESRLWDACRLQSRPRLDDLAQRIKPAAAWEDLVLPGAQKQALREIALQVRQRARVYETWGFASRGSRGLGISALFTGASGTGKTMAAEVLANELHLDLYRIDLSQVVSKYIGETEKNLRKVFDAAEGGGALLFFDEADALFGKRSEVKDSHDRYANIEISYLLQRMESYRGLAILTTNMKSALDGAFLRRLRFVVQFPFPDAGQRAEIWRRIFPGETPTEGLNRDRLARLNVAGGNIRNIALHAAFLAADAGEPVRMKHLLNAARAEYAKMERPLTDTEIAGWL